MKIRLRMMDFHGILPATMVTRRGILDALATALKRSRVVVLGTPRCG